ncbi:hypothetical protein AHAS_Ahas11G0142600 [Arachis hypogaea]
MPWCVTQPFSLSGGGVFRRRIAPYGRRWYAHFKDQQLKQKMINGLSMEIGDGRGTRFWEDVWVRGGILKDLFPRLFSVSNQRGSVIRASNVRDMKSSSVI